MSMASVRAGVSSFLTLPPIDGLRAVKKSMPLIVPGQDYGTGGGWTFGAVGIVHIAHSSDVVRAGGNGPHLERAVSYTLDFVLSGVDSGGNAEAATDNWDALVEAVKVRLRSDPALGTSGTPQPILFAGVGNGVPNTNSPDLIVDTDFPRQNKGAVYFWAKVQFFASEVYIG